MSTASIETVSPGARTSTTPETTPTDSRPSSSRLAADSIPVDPLPGADESTVDMLEDDDSAAHDAEHEPSKAKKPRLPRISEACVRCKARKQRCVRSPGTDSCVNCAGVGADCVIAPRARRKNAKRPPPSEAPSIPTFPTPEHAYATLPPSAFYPYPAHPHSLSPSFPPNSLLFGGPTSVMLANQRPAFPPPPPPPLLHSPYDPGVSAPMRSTSMTAPVSDMRSGHLPSDPASSVSPTSVNESGASSSMAQRLRTTAEDQSMPVESEEEENEGDVEEEEDGPGWHDQAARGVAFLSLSANGNPTYVGPSSGFSWARMVLGGIAGAAANEGGKYSSRATELDTSQPFVTGPPVQPVQLSDDALASITDEMADSLLSQCYRHIQPRYSFVDWLYVHEIWAHRLAITRAAALPGASRMMKTSAFFIWILFAIGARIGQKSAPTGLATPEAYYRKSMEYLETIVGLHDLKNVQALMLMVMYSFRSNEAPGVWYLVGISLRVACSLGLHRKVPPMQARRMSPYIIQLRRRIFWSVYTLDRMLAMSLGRPCGIADHDCDVELPLDFDCIATSFDTKNPPTGPTSMTSSILFTKLMRIETMIQKQAYRVDVSTPSSVESPDAVLKLIDQWEAQIPAAASDPNCWTIPLCSRDWLLARSGEARLYLLRPLTADPATAQPSHVRLIARFAADACETQKRFHQAQSVSLSLEALRSIFLSGLTLLHAVQLDNTAVSFSTLSKAIRAASNTMFLYAQSFPGARAYSEVFEELSSAVLDKLSAPNESSAPPPGLSDSAAATPLFQSLWDDIPSVMTNDAQDSFLALLESLGVPTDTLVDSASGNPFFSGGGAAGLDLSELGGFGPAAGGLEPFAVGTSSGGLW